MLAIFNMIGGPELIVLLIVGLILFGGRLPDVGKSVGKSLIQFRKGLRDLKQDIGLDEVTDLRRDLGQLTQAHYNLLDVNDDELDDRKESLEGAESSESSDSTHSSEDSGGQGDQEAGAENLEVSNSNSKHEASQPDSKGPEESKDGPFAREDDDPQGESLDDLGIPMPRSEEPDSGKTNDPPKFGYKS